jgi:hypothetical protein
MPDRILRVREYVEELRRKLSLCEMLVKAVSPGREHHEP